MKNNKKPRLMKILSLLFVVIILISFVIPNSMTSTRSRARVSTYSSYDLFTVHGGSLAGGLGAGDFDNDSYQELVVVGGSSEGNTNLIDYNKDSDEFESELLWWDPNGGLVALAVGELDSSHFGPEILVGGYSGNLTQLNYNAPGEVTHQTIWNATSQNNTSKLNHIFGISIGELDDRYPGNEIAVVDAATYYLYLLANNNGTWVETKVHLGDLPRSVEIGEFDATADGEEVLVMCVNGTVYKVVLEKGTYTWSVVQLFKDTNTPFNAIFDDFNSSHPGNEVLLTGLSWNATMLWGSGAEWFNKTIWTAPGALEGIAYGDFDHLHEGKELCFTGYSNTAVMVYETAKGWYNELIYTDPDPLQTELNGVLALDFYEPNPGIELIIIGFSGKIRMLTFEPPDFKLLSPSTSKNIIADEFATFQINLQVSSGYNSKVQLSLSGAPPKSNINFSNTVLNPAQDQDKAILTSVLTIETSLETPSDVYELIVTGTGINDNRQRAINLTLIVNPSENPDFQLEITPTTKTLNLSRGQYFVEFEINLNPIDQFDDTVDISIDELILNNPDFKNYVEYSITPMSIQPGESAVLNISVSEKLKKSINFDLKIYVRNSALALEHTQNVKLNLIYYESPDKDPDGEAEDYFPQWVGLGLMVIVIIVITGFLLKRMRDVTKQQQAWRERQLEQREHRGKGKGKIGNLGPGSPPRPGRRYPPEGL